MFFSSETSDHYLFNVILNPFSGLDYFQVTLDWGMWFFTGDTV